MRRTLIASACLHLAVLVWALVEFPFAREFDVPEVLPLPVDILTPEEFTRIKAGTRDAPKDEAAAKAKPAEKPAEAKRDEPRKAAEAKPAAAPEPKPAEPSVKAAEDRKPETEPKKDAAAAPPPVPRPAPPKPKVVEKTEPARPKPPSDQAVAAKKPDFNPDRIAALLNKVPDAGPKAAPQSDTPPPAQEQPARGQTSGQDATMSLSELDALRQRISQCWIPPVGGMGAEQIRVRLRLQLNPDGSLTRPPEIVNRDGSAFFQVAADSAVRAVWQCQPYQLPAAKYAQWRDMILNFDPREMFGG